MENGDRPCCDMGGLNAEGCGNMWGDPATEPPGRAELSGPKLTPPPRVGGGGAGDINPPECIIISGNINFGWGEFTTRGEFAFDIAQSKSSG